MKLKNLLLTAGTMSVTTLPLATTVACGSESSTVRFWFTLTNDFRDTMEDLISEYNENHKESGMTDVELIPFSGGYNEIPTTLEIMLQTNDQKQLPSLAFGYNDHLAVVSEYDKLLDLGQTEDDEMGVDRTIFNESFVNGQDEVTGVEAGTLHSIPGGKSTDLLYVNQPVTQVVLDTLIDAGATMGTDTDIVDSIMNGNFAQDNAFITGQFGSFVPLGNLSNEADGIVIDDTMFTTMTGLLDLAIISEKLFEEDGRGITMGMDPSTNYMYNYGFSMAEANYEEFYFSKDADEEMEWRFNKAGSNERQTFEQLYDKWRDTVESGMFVQNGGGAFSSADQINHKIAYSLGSSAGYSHNSTADSQNTLGSDELLVLAAPRTFGETPDNGNTAVESTLVQGPSLFGVSKSSELDASSRAFSTWLYDETVTFTVGDETITGRPMEWWAETNSYIVPTSDVLNGNKPPTFNPAQSTMFDELQSVQNNPNHYAFENPASLRSAAARDFVAETMRAMYGIEGTTPDFETFLSSLNAADKTGENIFRAS